MESQIVPITRAIKMLKEECPFVSRGLIYQALENNQIGCIRVGNKRLVDIAQIKTYLANACDPKYSQERIQQRK